MDRIKLLIMINMSDLMGARFKICAVFGVSGDGGANSDPISFMDICQ
jgi:hypothetical protein